MTKTEARKLIKQKATTRLKVVDVSLLHHLINAVFLGRGEDAQNHDVASRPANISIQTLAAKCGLKTEKAVCQHLRKLEAEKLITVSPNPQNLSKHVYTVHLEPMMEWESATTVAARKKKARLATRRVRERELYARRKSKNDEGQSAPSVERSSVTEKSVKESHVPPSTAFSTRAGHQGSNATKSDAASPVGGTGPMEPAHSVPNSAPEPNLSEQFDQITKQMISETAERAESIAIPDFAEWHEDGRDSCWGARRDIGRALTDSEIAELRRLNREHVMPIRGRS